MPPLERARQALADGRLEDAELSARAAAEGGNRAGLLVLGEVLLRRGRHAEAARILAPRLEASPDDAELADIVARAWDGAGRADEAIAALARRLTLVPDDANAAVRLCELLLERKQAVDAGRVARAALKSHPGDARLHVIVARSRLARGRVPQALEAAQEATRLGPRYADAWLHLARIHLASGDPEAAEKALRKCIEVAPQHGDALSRLGILLVDRRQPKAAAPVLEQAVQIVPDQVTAWNALAAARHQLGDSDGALEAVDKAIALAPRNLVLLRNRSEILLDTGRCAEAVELAVETLELARQAAPEKGALDAAEEAAIRAIAADTISRYVCAGRNESEPLERELEMNFGRHGLKVPVASLGEVADGVRAPVQAALARCTAGKPPASVPPMATPASEKSPR